MMYSVHVDRPFDIFCGFDTAPLIWPREMGALKHHKLNLGREVNVDCFPRTPVRVSRQGFFGSKDYIPVHDVPITPGGSPMADTVVSAVSSCLQVRSSGMACKDRLCCTPTLRENCAGAVMSELTEHAAMASREPFPSF